MAEIPNGTPVKLFETNNDYAALTLWYTKTTVLGLTTKTLRFEVVEVDTEEVASSTVILLPM